MLMHICFCERLEGHYGTICSFLFCDHGRKIVRTMPVLKKGQVIGEFFLQTTDPSNPKYRDRTRYPPNSKIPNFRLADDGAILVEAMGGGDGIFQLYFFPQTNSFQGNLYEKRGLDNFKRSGSIILNRR